MSKDTSVGPMPEAMNNPSSVGAAVARDTEAARNGVKPQILTDVYGTKPPKAAVALDGSISDRQGAQEAQDARRNAVPGQYERR